MLMQTIPKTCKYRKHKQRALKGCYSENIYMVENVKEKIRRCITIRMDGEEILLGTAEADTGITMLPMHG